MCFPGGQKSDPIPKAPDPPSVSARPVAERMAGVQRTNIQSGVAQSVLTSPLGDPSFARSISRTVLTGFL